MVRDHPHANVPVGHVEPAPRRIHAKLAGAVVFDSRRAQYAWEAPSFPRHSLPAGDVDESLLAHLVSSERVTSRPDRNRTGASWSVRVGGAVYRRVA